ncbi:uncharacterized protein TA05800 [Theileria annulata]|uniref:C3H1-type domain-containing protein n=1 Tax=Theileria annulata TaxID=5874 RepID=Q4UI03_THEAN|nr:uncharacterized protein TA05800 [Theileria annulata]CAI73286.1 hypothetical protein, conserved [Theileria annulata]|eukprot:XP_953963.1 hypothetical protein, conserved [Theileria annulata]
MPILSEEDLERFRTKVCTLASSMKCDFGVERCNYSHNLYWARRCPFYLRDSSILRYIPQCCPDVELGEGTTVIRNSCPRGNNCSFAHSYEEIHYHPLVYKTEVCKDYRLGKCKTYYCHLVHGLAEYRVPKQYVLPKKVGLDIPEFAHVRMVDNIKSITSGNVSVGCFQKDKGNKSAEKSLSKLESKGKNKGIKEPNVDLSDSGNIKSWSSIKWKNKSTDKDNIVANNSDLVNGSISKDGNGKRDGKNSITNNFGNTNEGVEGETFKTIGSIENGNQNSENDPIYEWYKLISMPKVDYTDDNMSERNCSILKLYDKHIGNNLNEFNNLTIYNNGLNPYNDNYDNDLNAYGQENNINYENDKRNESLVTRNVNMWNDSNIARIIEANDNAIGTVSSIMGDSYQSYEDVFQSSDLASSINSINQDDIYSNVFNQCEVIKKNCRESIQNKTKWSNVVDECTKLLNLVIDANQPPQEQKEE